VDGEYRDMALVDVALSRERFVAARAIWDTGTLYEVFLTRAEPASIGLSSIGAQLHPLSLAEEGGLHYSLAGAKDGKPDSPAGSPGPQGQLVLAPIAPGIINQVPVSSWRRLANGERVAVERRHCTVALDGERAFTVTPSQQLEVSVERNGPPVVQVEAALHEAASRGLLRV
jgi:hypothetical protein